MGRLLASFRRHPGEQPKLSKAIDFKYLRLCHRCRRHPGAHTGASALSKLSAEGLADPTYLRWEQTTQSSPRWGLGGMVAAS
jgi:hypothetical protein